METSQHSRKFKSSMVKQKTMLQWAVEIEGSRQHSTLSHHKTKDKAWGLPDPQFLNL